MIEPDNIEIFYNVEGDYFDATKMTIQLVKPQTFDEIKLQILSDRAKIEALEKTKGSMERIIDSLDYGSMKEEVELLKHIQSILNSTSLNSKSVVGKT